MFIYPGSGGTNSIVEGDELSFLSSKNDSLVVSAIDGNLNLSIVSILLKSYNISNYSLPALIIDDKYVKQGFVNTSEIKDLICKYGRCLNFSCLCSIKRKEATAKKAMHTILTQKPATKIFLLIPACL